MLLGLVLYPVVDDNDLSALEQEQITEEWASWARSDFRAKLANAFEAAGHTRAADWVRDMPTEAIDTLYWRACEESHPEHDKNEVNFQLDRTVAKIGAEDLPPFPPMPKHEGCSTHAPHPQFGCPECVKLRDAFPSYCVESEEA